MFPWILCYLLGYVTLCNFKFSQNYWAHFYKVWICRVPMGIDWRKFFIIVLSGLDTFMNTLLGDVFIWASASFWQVDDPAKQSISFWLFFFHSRFGICRMPMEFSWKKLFWIVLSEIVTFLNTLLGDVFIEALASLYWQVRLPAKQSNYFWIRDRL